LAGIAETHFTGRMSFLSPKQQRQIIEEVRPKNKSTKTDFGERWGIGCSIEQIFVAFGPSVG